MKFPAIKNQQTPPDISIGGLSIWVQGREFPNASEPSDAEWLEVVASYASASAEAWVRGPILTTSDLHRWVQELRHVSQALNGTASLDPVEPDLHVAIVAETLGHMALTVKLRPDPVTETHKFVTEVDQSYLAPLISQIERVLQVFPLY